MMKKPAQRMQKAVPPASMMKQMQTMKKSAGGMGAISGREAGMLRKAMPKKPGMPKKPLRPMPMKPMLPKRPVTPMKRRPAGPVRRKLA